MNSIFLNFKNEVLEIFKKNYQKLILKNSNLTFMEVLNLTRMECDVQSSSENEHQFLLDWFSSVNKLSYLDQHFDSPFFELIIHSPQHGLRIENGKRSLFSIGQLNLEDFQLSLDSMAMIHHQKWNFQNPFVSFNALINNRNYRITLIHFSCTSNEISKIFIRSQTEELPNLKMFNIENNIEIKLLDMIKEKNNLIISGNTGSGKTTFLRSLIPKIDEDEHLVVLEDTYEIHQCHKGQTSLLSQKDMEGKSLKDYCAYALRMSPDRLIIGEMRSSEIVPFVLAMNTGHKGLMSTVHANSAIDAIHRAAVLFTLYSETKDISYNLVMKLLCKNIDYIIHLENKKIKEVIRIIGSEEDTPFYEDILAS